MLPLPVILRLVLTGLLALFCTVLLHEMGHAAACLLLRFRIVGVTLFSALLYRDGETWRLSRAPGGYGSVICYPRSERLLRLRMFLMCGAGPAASLAGGWVCVHFARHPAPGSAESLLVFLNITGMLSLLAGAASLLPTATPVVRSDGLWMWTALVKIPRTEQRLAEWLLRSSSLAGVRPRDWKPEVVARAIQGDEPTHASRWLEYNWHADSGRGDEAAAVLAWWLEQRVPAAWEGIWRYEAVWFDVFYRGDAAAAREHLEAADRFRDEAAVQVARWKAETALAAAEGRLDDAAAAARETERAMRRKPLDAGLSTAIRDDLAVLLKRTGVPPLVH